jgi:hypothetical protein
VFTQHPTLLIGPSDWDEIRAPKAEFDRRIDAMWAAFPNASQAIVFGSAAHHAELAYLTHFVPKLEPGIALLARDGQHKLLFGGGPNMIGAMQPLTFISDMAPLNALGKLIAGCEAPLLIGGGAATTAVRKTIDEATGGTVQDASAHVQALMRKKSPSELAAIRAACDTLNKAIAAIRDATHAGRGATAALLAGERAAIESGAQDVRTLLSLDGGRTLRPFEALDDRMVDPLQVYVAVRRFNHWAEGFATVAKTPHSAAAHAIALLEKALTALKPGLPVSELARIVSAWPPYRPHPVTQGALVSAMGLALDAPAPTMFEAGEVYSVRVGLTDGNNQHAIVSAMIAISDDGIELLWRSDIA